MTKLSINSSCKLPNLTANRGKTDIDLIPERNYFNSACRWQTTWVWLLLIIPQISWAAGTPVGTAITNTATLSYSLGVSPQPDISATSTAIVVDEKVNLTVTGGVVTTVAAGSTAQATAFTVTNNSNGTLDFALSVTDALGSDQFDPVALSCGAFVESGATPNYQAAQDTATFVDELAANATATVYVVCDIPVALALGDTGLVGLTATAQGNFNAAGYVPSTGVLGGVLAEAAANTANVDIAFADISGTEDMARDAKHSAHNTYLIGGATVSVAKTIVSVVDPQGGTVVMPGSVVTYQIAVAISGSGTVTSLVINDPLPAETTFVSGSLYLDSVLQTDAIANTLNVSLGDVAAPANHVITFRATIN